VAARAASIRWASSPSPNTMTPEIVSFDELLARAEWMTSLVPGDEDPEPDGDFDDLF
jgi:hypothetical protein